MRLIFKKISIIFLLLPIFLYGSNLEVKEPKWIVNKPIRLSKERIKLFEEYHKIHYDLDSIYMKPKVIVVHWTAMYGFWNNWNFFNKLKIGVNKRRNLKYGSVNVAVHYLIDRNGYIYKLMPDNIIGRHVIGINHHSIGIENIGKHRLTKRQLLSNVKLIEYLKNKYSTIKHVIGHFEYRAFEGTDLWKEKYVEFRSHKIDPGTMFMHRLRRYLGAIK